jgi:phosphatidylglycerophosphate synthase
VRGSRGTRLSWDGYSAGWAALHLGVDPRHSSRYVHGWLRLSYGVGRGLSRLGLRPGVVTLLGLLFAAAVPVVAVLRGWWLLAAAGLVLLSALADSADGAVAVISSRASRVGAFDDAMADRLSEAAWLLALWLVGGHGLVVVACGALSWLHEYARARAAAGGVSGIGVITTAERPTRVMSTIIAFVVGAVAWLINPGLTPGAVTVVLAVWAVLGLLGTLRLVSNVRNTLRV